MHSPESFTYINNFESEKGRITRDLAAMTETFGRELTPELAKDYIQSLTTHIGSAHETYGEFVKAGKEVHRKLGREVYGPVIVGYLQWVARTLQKNGVKNGPVHFALRDAWPFYEAAHVLWDGSKIYHPVGTYLNRPILGIEDEIAPEKATANGFVSEYLSQSGVVNHGSPVALVDSGAWGTVVRAIKQQYLPDTPFIPLFWYSHNPNIRGFLNEILPQTGIAEEFGEILNDSMECVFPQGYRRPLSFETTASGHTLQLDKSDPLSVSWGQAALEGVVEAAHAYKNGISDDDVTNAVQKLYALSMESHDSGKWTGVLPAHTPTWSKGAEFIASWPKGLLP